MSSKSYYFRVSKVCVEFMRPTSSNYQSHICKSRMNCKVWHDSTTYSYTIQSQKVGKITFLGKRENESYRMLGINFPYRHMGLRLLEQCLHCYDKHKNVRLDCRTIDISNKPIACFVIKVYEKVISTQRLTKIRIHMANMILK